MADENPFTAEDLARMKEGLVKLNSADNLIKKSIQAGIEMGPQQAETRELREKLTRMKSTFFPGQ